MLVRVATNTHIAHRSLHYTTKVNRNSHTANLRTGAYCLISNVPYQLHINNFATQL